MKSEVNRQAVQSTSAIAKWFIGISALIQSAAILGVIISLIQFGYFYLEYTGTDSKLMAEGIGRSLIPMVLGFGVSVLGTLTSLLTAVAYKYRAMWFFWWSLPFAILSVPALIGVVFLIYLFVNRREFLGIQASVGKKSAGLVFIAIWNVLWSLLTLIVGILLISGVEYEGGKQLVLGIICSVFSLIYFIAAYGTWSLRKWGRQTMLWLTIILLPFGLYNIIDSWPDSPRWFLFFTVDVTVDAFIIYYLTRSSTRVLFK